MAHADLTVVPDFVRATWSQKSGDLYVLDVTVPKDAPVGDYSGNFAGSLTIAPEHESIKPETLRLEFDVIEK